MTASVSWTTLKPSDWSCPAMIHTRVPHTHNVQRHNAIKNQAALLLTPERYDYDARLMASRQRRTDSADALASGMRTSGVAMRPCACKTPLKIAGFGST